jgi:hypothetical protein
VDVHGVPGALAGDAVFGMDFKQLPQDSAEWFEALLALDALPPGPLVGPRQQLLQGSAMERPPPNTAPWGSPRLAGY